METKKIGCLVMAAGSGTRFGGGKLTAEVAGKTLIRRALEAVPEGVFSDVVVAAQEGAIRNLAESFGFRFILNNHPDRGVGRTIRLGTEAMSGCAAILYMVADQPFLTGETVKRVAEAWRGAPEMIAGASCGGRRGNPNIFPARFFPELLALDGDRGGSRVIRAHEDCFLPVETPERELVDCDTREIWDEIQRTQGQDG
jgi:molybdenum cofactor cytidylyltransferase